MFQNLCQILRQLRGGIYFYPNKSNMTLELLLKDFTTYNLWANRLMVDWLQKKPAELMTREVPSSFPSLHLTMLHIWGAEKVWIERLNSDAPGPFLTQSFVGTTEEVFKGLLSVSEQFRDLVAGQDAAYFTGNSSYVHINGNSYTQNRAQMILHCMQHSTYHRGQLVTMARNLGLSDPPQTDYIAHVRLQNL